jgi:hypothetical protein
MKAPPELPALWGRINADTLQQLTGCHRTTAARWKRLVRVPRWLEVLVATVIEGRLDALGREFAGWRLHQGALVSPEGLTVTQGQIRALPQLCELRRALELELQLLREELAVVKQVAVPLGLRGRLDRRAGRPGVRVQRHVARCHRARAL